MSLVTCDVVEASTTASSTTFASIDSTVSVSSVARSVMIWAISSLIVDSAVASDDAYLQPVMNVVEVAVASSSVITQGVLTGTLIDRATASDALLYTPEELAVSSGVATSEMLTSRSYTVHEGAVATDSATPTAQISWSVTDLGSASSALFGFNDYVATDAGTAASSVLLSIVRSALLNDAGTASDEAIFASDLVSMLTDTATASSITFAQLMASEVVTDTAEARDRAIYALTALGWVMNTESFGMSRYTALPFSSLAVVNGRVLALGDAGLYELAGDTDDGAPIHASIATGRSMLGSDVIKRVPEVHITGTADGELRLTVAVYGERKGSYAYAIPQRTADAPRGHRVKLGKGLSSMYWKFTLSNTDGADFVVDFMSADVAPSTNRRI